MISFLIKYKKVILIITLAFFIGSIGYLGLSSYASGALNTNVATVGGTSISYRDFYRAADAQARALRENGIDVDESMTRAINQRTLSGLISEEVLNQAAASAGQAVSDYEVASDIRTLPMFDQAGVFNKAAYEYALRHQLGVTPLQFEEQMRRSKLAERFGLFLSSFYKLTPNEVRFVYQAQHGNLKDFDANKKDFERQLFQTKMETAQKAFFDDFNNRVTIKTYLED